MICFKICLPRIGMGVQVVAHGTGGTICIADEFVLIGRTAYIAETVFTELRIEESIWICKPLVGYGVSFGVGWIQSWDQIIE